VSVSRGDSIGLLSELVRIDSRNPALCANAPGENAVARRLCALLREWGVDAQCVDALPGRPNVVARIRGSSNKSRSLMFNGHIDVVGTEGMVHAPFEAIAKNGRVYGRGAADMKGGVAAMCGAAARAMGSLKGDLIIAAVVDEEWQSAGTRALLQSGIRADAAIVTEPTGLAVMPAHRGFVWIEVVIHGRAAHGSRWDLGVDAIRHAGLLLAELDRIDSEQLPKRAHELLGRASLHAGFIEGGIGISTYPDRCVLRIERRTIPGEDADVAKREVDDACARVREMRGAFHADVAMLFSQPPSDVSPDAPIVHALRDAAGSAGMKTTVAGMSAWTDAALLNAAGIPAVCFGPGDMGLAHAAEEYIPVEEVERATDILETLAKAWCD
jgi:acetylornithine deacetylase